MSCEERSSNMQKELLVGESRDQLRGEDVTGHILSCYHSKRELAGRLMLVAEKSAPVHSGGEYQELVLESQ